MDNKRGSGLKYKLVSGNRNGLHSAKSLQELEGIIVIDVYEGYNKIGRFKLSEIRCKFG